eukprot:jgi/Tetstr1/456458/TSEL_043182.t1
MMLSATHTCMLPAPAGSFPRSKSRRGARTTSASGAMRQLPSSLSTPRVGSARRALGGLPPRRLSLAVRAIKQTSVADAAEKREVGWVYLDVRTVEEFEEARVPGSINVPVFNRGPGGMVPNPEFAAVAMEALAKDTPQVLVGCKSGQRSQTAIQILEAAGCELEMENVDGGIMAWAQSQLPLEQ